jgi:hypothetical protein
MREEWKRCQQQVGKDTDKERDMKIRMCVSVVMALIAVAVLLPLSFAGDLNPTGPPAPTMKTLDQIPPTWDQALASDNGEADGCNSSRFKCVLAGWAVLDKETGLVWERNPQFNWVQSWNNTVNACYSKISLRGGWRLPTVEELSSLRVGGGGLPGGHPFQNIQITDIPYWTITIGESDSSQAYAVPFFNVVPDKFDKTSNYFTWCVRGPAR